MDFIERHGDSRFTNVVRPNQDRGAPIDVPAARDRAGWWEEVRAEISASGATANVNGHRIYLFTGAGLREAIGDLDWNRALRALDEAGAFFEKGTDGEKAKRRRTPNGGNPKLYWIDPEKLQL